MNADDLHQAAKKVDSIVGETAKSDFGHLIGGGDAYGHDGLHAKLIEFCSAAQTASELLEQNSKAAAEALRTAGRAYQETEAVQRDLMNQQGAKLAGFMPDSIGRNVQ